MKPADLDQFLGAWDERVSVGGVELRLLSPMDADPEASTPPVAQPDRWPGLFIWCWRGLFGAPDQRLDAEGETRVVRAWVGSVVHPDDRPKLDMLNAAQLVAVFHHYKGLRDAWTARVAGAAARASSEASKADGASRRAQGGDRAGIGDRLDVLAKLGGRRQGGMATPIVAGEPLPGVLGGVRWGRLAEEGEG